MTIPAFGQVFLQYEEGAFHPDWSWEVQTYSHRPHTACYHSCCNLPDRQQIQIMAPVCAHRVCT